MMVTLITIPCKGDAKRRSTRHRLMQQAAIPVPSTR